jgi:biotin transport system substrate-specific component
MAIAVSATPRTLADRIPVPSTKVRDVALVIGFALFTAAAAQAKIALGFTPVPITGQTLAVLLAGGVLGWKRGAASQALYVALGAVGLPFYAGAEGGWEAATGSTAGYLVGFVLAAAFVGRLAERGQDRALITAVPAMLAGSALIYATGVWWLAHSVGVSTTEAIELGLVPFLVGDLVKVAIAGFVLPGAWRAVRA